MKSTAIDSSVLGGQGCIGAKVLTVANPAPPQGTTTGIDPTTDLQIPAAAAAHGAVTPTDHYTMPSGSNTPSGQYSTIGPIPQG